MQEYRSGHNEAVLKTVWVKAHGGSNPSSCAKNERIGTSILSFFVQNECRKKPRISGGSREEREKRKREKEKGSRRATTL